MKLRIDVYTILSLILSVVTFTAFQIFSNIFKETLIFHLGVPFAIAVFFFFRFLLSSTKEKISLEISSFLPNLVSSGVTVASILAVILIPPFEGTFLEWMSIPPLNWVRYLSSILLTLFLPGYFVLKILDRKRLIRGGIVIVLSYLLSMFVTFLTGFFILLSGNSIDSLGVPAVVSICLSLMTIYLVVYRKADNRLILALDPIEFGAIVAVFSVVMLGSTTIMLNTMPLRSGDMTSHYGLVLQFVDRFPSYGGKLIAYPGGYLFHINLAILFSLSGIPLALAEQGLFAVSFLPVLAFYSAIKAWFSRGKGKKIPVVSLFFSTLLGWGGLYALYHKLLLPSSDTPSLLRVTTYKTYDIYMRLLYLPDNAVPIFLIGLPVFFTLLYFLKEENQNFTRTLVVPLLVTIGYLGHTAEVVLFVFALFIYTVLFRRSGDPKTGLHVVFGLFMVFILDLSAPAQTYVTTRAGTSLSVPFLFCLGLSILVTAIELIKDKKCLEFPKGIKDWFLVSFEKVWSYVKWALLWVYLFLIVIWLAVVDTFNLWAWGGYSFTPYFVWPIRFGLVGLLTIIVVYAYLPRLLEDRRLSFFLSLVILGFVLEQLANYYPYVGVFYPSYRFGTIAFIGGCVIAAYGVIKILSNRKSSLRLSLTKRNTIISCLLIPLLLLGFLSTTLYYTDASICHGSSSLPKEELKGLNYVHQNLPNNASVLTFTKESANKLRNFAGINPVQDAQRWSKLLLSTSNPYIITYILGSSNVKYIYLPPEDIKLLSSNSVLKSFIEYFRKVFENDYVTIYEVPPLTPPSFNASLGVFHVYLPKQKLENTSWRDDSFLREWAFYGKYGDVLDWSTNSDGDILKINVTSNQEGNVWVSYSLPLALKTKKSFLSFRYRVDNDYTWFTIILHNASHRLFFYRGHLTDKTFTTKLYSLPDDQIITRVEIVVETTDKAPARASAIAYLDYIEISQWAFTEDDVFPALFAASLQSRYSSTYVDSVLMKNINAYISHYTHILLTSDPSVPIEGLLNWVLAGGSLIVFNTHGNGFFSDLLGINSSFPFLSTKKIGLGKVLYINLEVGEKSELLKPEFIKKIKEDLTLDKYVYKVDTLPVYNSTFGNIEIDGNLNLSTDVLKIQAHAINLAGMSFQPNGSAEILVYGRVTLTINNTSLLISPLESYLMVKPEGYHVEGEVFIEGNNSLIIVVDTNAVYSFNTPISFKFKAAGASIHARLPSINASGIITFDQLDVHEALYVPLAGIVQQKAEVQGNVKFSTMYISSLLIMFSTFQAEGKTLNLAEMASRRSIPWFNVLTSPHNVIFNIIFLLGITICIVKKRIRRRS